MLKINYSKFCNFEKLNEIKNKEIDLDNEFMFSNYSEPIESCIFGLIKTQNCFELTINTKPYYVGYLLSSLIHIFQNKNIFNNIEIILIFNYLIGDDNYEIFLDFMNKNGIKYNFIKIED